MRDVSATTATLKGVDWNSLRRKAWHAILMGASAYAAVHPTYAWAVPVLTGMAGVSAPPTGLSRGAAACLIVAAGLLGLVVSVVI